MKYDYLVEKILYLERAENIKNFGDVVPHPIGDKVGALLTRLSDIESAEPSEAMEALRAFYHWVAVLEDRVGDYEQDKNYLTIRTALLKAQALEIFNQQMRDFIELIPNGSIILDMNKHMESYVAAMKEHEELEELKKKIKNKIWSMQKLPSNGFERKINERMIDELQSLLEGAQNE